VAAVARIRRIVISLWVLAAAALAVSLLATERPEDRGWFSYVSLSEGTPYALRPAPGSDVLNGRHRGRVDRPDPRKWSRFSTLWRLSHKPMGLSGWFKTLS